MNACNRRYLRLLIAFGALLLYGGVRNYQILYRAAAAEGRDTTIGLYVLITVGFYLAFIVVTVILRVLDAAIAPGVTRALNTVLLLAFPLGTVLGIYGLWKVDHPTPLSALEDVFD